MSTTSIGNIFEKVLKREYERAWQLDFAAEGRVYILAPTGAALEVYAERAGLRRTQVVDVLDDVARAFRGRMLRQDQLVHLAGSSRHPAFPEVAEHLARMGLVLPAPLEAAHAP